ncbi:MULTISPECIES: hypothetical protein [unclassified Micromonospora]|uniref:hypothetical protein n=1 Tax=unclassified Micromonospora TaxID=2617518 RepID=UPI00331D9574
MGRQHLLRVALCRTRPVDVSRFRAAWLVSTLFLATLFLAVLFVAALFVAARFLGVRLALFGGRRPALSDRCGRGRRGCRGRRQRRRRRGGRS